MTAHSIVAEEELRSGEHVTVQLDGREITVFNVEDDYFAYTNWCPHQSGPVCEGMLSGTWDAEYDRESGEVRTEWCRTGEILNCPWHGWEFDVKTGDCLSRNVRLIAHDVEVRDGEILLTL